MKKVPLLRGKSVFNLFFENSTRTHDLRDRARLSADVLNLNINASSTSKGESLLDTINNLSAMHADLFVVRRERAPYLIAEHCAPHARDQRRRRPPCAPTQGLLMHDPSLQARLHEAARGDRRRHPAFARRALRIHALTTLGVPEVRAIGPRTLLPGEPNRWA